jgi:bacterioferritin-associated ferredoxin
MPVTRCICFNVSFEELKSISEKEKIEDIEKLREKKEFGLNCGMCNHYVKMMLKSKKSSFDVI